MITRCRTVAAFRVAKLDWAGTRLEIVVVVVHGLNKLKKFEIKNGRSAIRFFRSR